MGRRRKCEGSRLYCDCRQHENERNRAEAARWDDDSSDSTHETLGIVADAALAGTSLFGMATSLPEPPNTDQLDDSRSGQHQRWRDETKTASDRRNPGTNQPK